MIKHPDNKLKKGLLIAAAILIPFLAILLILWTARQTPQPLNTQAEICPPNKIECQYRRCRDWCGCNLTVACLDTQAECDDLQANQCQDDWDCNACQCGNWEVVGECGEGGCPEDSKPEEKVCQDKDGNTCDRQTRCWQTSQCASSPSPTPAVPEPTPTPTPTNQEPGASPTPTQTPPTPTLTLTPTPEPEIVFSCEKLTVNSATGTPQDSFTFTCKGKTNVANDVIDQVRFTITNSATGDFESIIQTKVEKAGEDADGTMHFEAKLENYRFKKAGNYEVQAQVHSQKLDKWHPEVGS